MLFVELLQIVHRDIAARNMLVKKCNQQNRSYTTKIGDFGLAKDVKQTGVFKTQAGVSLEVSSSRLSTGHFIMREAGKDDRM